MNPTRRSLLRCLALLLLFALPARADGPTQPRKQKLTAKDLLPHLTEEWYGIYVRGKKCGYAHLVTRRGKNRKDPTFETEELLVFKLLAMGKKQSFRVRELRVYDGTAPFKLRSGWLKRRRGSDRTHLTATRRADGGFEVVVRSGKHRQTLQQKAMDYRLTDLLANRLWLPRGQVVGATMSNASLTLGSWELSHDTSTVRAVRQVVLDGVKTRVYDVELQNSKRGRIGQAVIDGRGTILNARLMGTFELRLEPKKLAKRTDYSADLFLSGLARVDQPLGDPRTLTRLALRVEGKAAGELVSGPRQTVTRKDGVTTLVVDVRKGKGRAVAASDRDRQTFLEETPEVPCKHPKIVALAKQGVGDAKTPAEKVNKLVTFVADYIVDATGRDSLSVLGIVERKQGDCDEHAALFTAVARAAGIPCREVTGLMYMGDKTKAFGGHAWNEVILDGKWVPVDPTWDETSISAARIRLHADGETRRAHRVWGRIRLIKLEAVHDATKRRLRRGDRALDRLRRGRLPSPR